MNENIKRKFTWKKLLGIAVLTLFLQFPIFQIQNLTTEREQLNSRVNPSSTQMIFEPLIKVPVTTNKFGPDGNITATEENEVFLIPDSSEITLRLDAKGLQRGLHKFADYQSEVIINTKINTNISAIEEKFNKQNILKTRKEFRWGNAKLLMGFAKSPELSSAGEVKFKTGYVSELSASNEKFSNANYVFESPIYLDFTNQNEFTINLKLRDQDVLDLRTFSQSSKIKMDSNWTSPGFRGSILPSQRAINSSGFTSEWNTYNYNIQNNYVEDLSQISTYNSDIGVSLYNGIDHYRLVHRVFRFQLLIFFIIFITFILIEIIQEIPVHPIQYLLVGAALCLFYLILLSTSEQIGFALAYFVAATVSAVLISGYSAAILKCWRKGMFLFGVNTFSFGTIYILLQSENDTLLLGTTALTLALAIIMYRTRNIDWYALDSRA